MKNLKARRLVGLLSATVIGVTIAATSGVASADPVLSISYDAVGSSHIGSINTTLPVGPATLTTQVDFANGAIVGGSLPLPSKVVQFNALGFIPIRSTVSFIETTPVTGGLGSGNVTTVTSTVKYTIQLTNMAVNTFGIWIPLFVGNHCQTINPVSITVSTPAGQFFDPTDGGNLTGKYTIGNFQNCAPLQLPDIFGVGSLAVNALLPGTNNTISLQVSNGQIVG